MIVIEYYGDMPKSCDDCYLIKRIERYVGKVKTLCPISGYGRAKGKRSVSCPFIYSTNKKGGDYNDSI